MMNDHAIESRRLHDVRLAVQLEAASLLWIVTETALSAIAALSAGSLAISAFSVDSAVELLSGVILFLRLVAEYLARQDLVSQVAERIASFVVGTCLVALAAYISFRSGQLLAARTSAEVSHLGIGVAAASGLITPWLARAKYRLGLRMHSHALMGDAACGMTCAYMAWTLLAGLLLQWAFGWWWIDPVAAVGILYFVMREAGDSLHAAWHGGVHVH
jgi:divalent metal cation (Fe/Co/Zn/Cd) transporter